MGTPSPNFKKFGENFVNFEILVKKIGFLAQRVARRARPIRLGDPNHKWFAFLDLS